MLRRSSAGSSWARLGAGLREVAVWALLGAAALAVVGIPIDFGLMLAAGVPARQTVGGGLAAGATGALVAFAAAPLVAVLVLLSRRLAAARSALRHAWPAPIALVALAGAWLIASPLDRRLPALYVAVVATVTAAVAACAYLARARTNAATLAAAGLLTVGAAAVDVALWSDLYPEMHGVCQLVIAAGAVAALVPLRRRWLDGLASRSLVVAVMVTAGLAVVVVETVDTAAPGWRAPAVRHGRHARRFARALRAVVDLDRDGFSPIAWGGDCDDLDGAVHPLAVDEPGDGDTNCNGVDPPRQPADQDRGLAAPAGSAALSPNAAGLTVLITIDSLRADALEPALMPQLCAYAQRGARFTRAYAAGAKTGISLPALQRADDHSASVAEIAEAAGLSTHAALGWGEIHHEYFVRLLASLHFPHSVLVGDSERATDVAVANIEAAAGRRHYQWIHYMDPHTPEAVGDTRVPDVLPQLPAAYKAALVRVDHHLGRLLAAIDRTGVPAVVIITSDHGEGFGEHGVYDHGRSGYDVIVRVPAIIIAPGLRPGDHDQLVSHRDLPATLLGALGLAEEAAAAESFGRSWLRLRSAPEARLHEFVVVRSARYASGADSDVPLGVIVDERYKLVFSYPDRLAELYDLASDSGERRDVAASAPEVVDRLRRALALYGDLDGYPASFRAN